jgi:small ligand-binding sensory domain FIST
MERSPGATARPRAGSGLSDAPDAAEAGRAAARAALADAGCEHADAALLFAGAEHGPAAADLLDAVADVLGCDPVGATAQGVMAGGQALESGPSVAVLALAGIGAEPFLLDRVAGAEGDAGAALAHALAAPVADDDLVVLFPDPYAVAAGPLLESVRGVAGDRVVGAGAVEGVGAPPTQWAEGTIATGAVAGLVLRGARPRVGVTQACRPVTPPLQVTRSDGHWILEIEGRPALDVFRETAREPLASDLRRAAAFVLLALPEPGDPEASLAAGDYRVRNVAGFAEGAFAVPEPVPTGTRIGLVLREPHGARDDLKRMLQGLAGVPAAFGLYLDCCARGAALFEVPGLEAAYLAEALGPLPTVGMMGAYEIGPVRGRSELLTYTGVLVLAGGDAGASGQGGGGGVR